MQLIRHVFLVLFFVAASRVYKIAVTDTDLKLRDADDTLIDSVS